MALVFSTQFFSVISPDQGNFPVPAGKVAVIRFMTARTVAGTVNPQYIVFIGTPDVVVLQGFVQTPDSTKLTASVAREARIVVKAGQYIKSLNDANVAMTVSGYLLNA